MAALTEGKLQFDFPAAWVVTKYDDWSHYRNKFQSCCNGNKAVDFLALESSGTQSGVLWMIEVKDYRLDRRTKTVHLWDEVAEKMRDTLAGLVVAAMDDSHDNHTFARKALHVGKLRVILHLEQPKTSTKLRPRPFNRADVEQKLKQLVKPLDAHPQVVELAVSNNCQWTTSNS